MQKWTYTLERFKSGVQVSSIEKDDDSVSLETISDFNEGLELNLRDDPQALEEFEQKRKCE